MGLTIDIDREKKLMLLDWLRKGVIDADQLNELNSKAVQKLTREEIEAELDRLTAWNHDEECERLKRLGYCRSSDNDNFKTI